MSILTFIISVSLSFSVNAEVQVFLTDNSVERIGTRFYKKELMTNQFQEPTELIYDSSSRNLYFTYMDEDLQNSGRALINVLTKETIKIKGIQNNKAIAINEENSDVYFGSNDGLYKYDPIQHNAKNIGLYNINIMKLVIRRNTLYVLDANTHKIYKSNYETTMVRRFSSAENVVNFEIHSGDVHFVSVCGLFCIPATAPDSIVKNRDLSIVYNFIVDGNSIYGMSEDGVYDLHCMNGTANKVGTLNFLPSSMTLGDYGDLYYSYGDDIYKLRPISTYIVYNLSLRRRRKPKNN